MFTFIFAIITNIIIIITLEIKGLQSTGLIFTRSTTAFCFPVSCSFWCDARTIKCHANSNLSQMLGSTFLIRLVVFAIESLLVRSNRSSTLSSINSRFSITTAPSSSYHFSFSLDTHLIFCHRHRPHPFSYSWFRFDCWINSSSKMSCFGYCSRCRYMNYDVEERELYERNRIIEKQLNRERRQMRQEVKLLLLGKIITLNDCDFV